MFEIFAGCCRLTGAALQKGLACGCPLELKNGKWMDLTNSAALHAVSTWIVRGGGLVCLAWYPMHEMVKGSYDRGCCNVYWRIGDGLCEGHV